MQFNWENIGIKTRVDKNVLYFFDPVRKRYLQVTPEEEVRQWLIYYLRTELEYPLAAIAVEKQITYLKRKKRFDILVYVDHHPMMLIECKAPDIELTQKTLNQIGQYNFILKVPYLMVSNGKQHLVCKANLTEKSFLFLDAIPPYKSLSV
ncbi:MAG: type I restriction enzyme HsdR N-terminal domain-containing protein [Bacteroidia bacterium]|nr:type I restriction enzyme HsdR N-terminal domain-containing protein [Bacteroidia bacterium]